MFYLMEVEPGLTPLQSAVSSLGQLLCLTVIVGLWVNWLWEDRSDYEAKDVLPMCVLLTLLLGFLGFLHPQSAAWGLVIVGIVGFIYGMHVGRLKIRGLRRRYYDMRAEMKMQSNERDLLIKRMGGEGLVPLEFDWKWRLHYMRTGAVPRASA